MKKKNILIGTILVTMASVIGIYAFYASSDNIKNTFAVGVVDIEVDEKFEISDAWNGDLYQKNVRVENKSTVNVFIRVAVEPRWIDELGNDWPGDVSIINISYINLIESASSEVGWVNGNDGYYYYNKKMLPTQDDENKFTKELITSVEAKIPENLKDRYSGKKLIVEIKSEAVQAFGDAYKVSWTTANDEIKNMLENLSK